MEPFIGEIRAFAFGFNPLDWALCNGQLLNVQQYQALFSVIGTMYGGNGTTTFGVPNLQGCVVIGTGQQPGGTAYVSGDDGGQNVVSLDETEVPPHSHTMQGATVPNALVAANIQKVPSNTTYISNFYTQNSPTSALIGRGYNGAASTPAVTLNAQTINLVGGGQAHENRMPFLVMNYCIALYGDYPVRS